MIRRLNAMPLRSRLALLAALTVALAVAACAMACWFLVRAQLLASLDDSLRESSDVDPGFVIDQVGSGGCTTNPSKAPNPFDASVQVVDVHGKSCVIVGSKLDVKDGDVAVAKGERSEAVHDALASDGTDYRVLTVPVRNTEFAVTVARPLTEVDEPLRNLALVLALVGGAGVLGAAGAGVAVARAGLRPVDRLTGVVEHIARTEDLAVRIPTEGDDEIARLSRSFNSMTASLAASRELQQQLIADAGHELRTPLTSLRTNIDLLVRSEESGRPLPADDRRALLESITAQMAELSALIGDLQLLSRPEAAPGSTELNAVGLHEVVRRAVDRARLRAGGVTVTVSGELAPWYVRAEPTVLERAVVNILDNGVKFSRGTGTVEVSLSEGVLRVRDHGPGIPQEELPYVYDRFWRSPSARSLPGSGLGLSIVARVVQQAGGEVELAPAEDGQGGTVAALRLPGASVPSSQDEPSVGPDAGVEGPEGAPEGAWGAGDAERPRGRRENRRENRRKKGPDGGSASGSGPGPEPH